MAQFPNRAGDVAQEEQGLLRSLDEVVRDIDAGKVFRLMTLASASTHGLQNNLRAASHRGFGVRRSFHFQSQFRRRRTSGQRVD